MCAGEGEGRGGLVSRWGGTRSPPPQPLLRMTAKHEKQDIAPPAAKELSEHCMRQGRGSFFGSRFSPLLLRDTRWRNTGAPLLEV